MSSLCLSNDKFADFTRAAAPFDWDGVLHCGKGAAAGYSVVDAFG